MRLNIYTFPNPMTDGEGTLAICIEDGKLTKDGVVATSCDARAASIAALHNYWAREDERAQAAQAIKDAESLRLEPTVQEAGLIGSGGTLSDVFTRRVAIGAGDIVELLTEAVEQKREVRLSYRDSEGNYTVRTIKPAEVWCSAGGIEYVRAYDVMQEDARTFRIDRVERVEFI